MSLLTTLKKKDFAEDWKLKSLGQLLVQTQYGSNEPSNSEGKLSVVGMKDIQNGKILTEELPKINLPDVEKEKYLLKKNDILINRTNSYDLVGKVGLFNSEIEAIFVSYLVRLIIKDEIIDPIFLNYWLNSYKAQSIIKKIATKAVSQANINPTELKKFCLVPVPPLPEQKAIASILSIWDDAIDKTEKLIKEKEKALHKVIQIEITKKSSKWIERKPEEIFGIISEKNSPNSELLSVTQDRGVIPRSMLDGRVMSPDGTTASYKLIKKGDFVISLRSFQGGIEFSNYEGIISPAYTVLRPKLEINTEYFRHFFKSYIFIKKYLNKSVIGIRDGKQISIPDFLTIKIPVPELETQTEIAMKINSKRKELEILKILNEQYKKQKRGLMQKLLTGKWRIEN